MKKVFYLLIVVVFVNNIYANNKLNDISILQKKIYPALNMYLKL